MSVISGTIAAINQRKKDKAQNQLTAQQNQQQMAMDLAARGAGLYGSGIPEELQGRESAILPYYMGGSEAILGKDAANVAAAIRAAAGDPTLRLADYSAMLGKYDAASEANDRLAEDLALGNITNEQLAEAAPVWAARTGAAESRRNAGLEALRETLNEIDSIQAGKGYSGDSTGKRMLRFNARRAIGTQAATDFAGANLENEMDRRMIKESGRNARLSNIDLPNRLAMAAIQRKQLPANAVASEFNAATEPLNFFNIGAGQFRAQNPLTAPSNSATGIANSVAQAGASVGGALSKYYGNKSLENQARINASGYGDYGAKTAAIPSYSGGDWASSYDASTFGAESASMF